VRVPRGAVAADAHANGAGAAALALGLPDGVEDALAHAFEVAIGAPRCASSTGNRVLCVAVLAAAALQQQLHFDGVLLPLVEGA